LVQAGIITNIICLKPYYISERSLMIYGFPFGHQTLPPKNSKNNTCIAVAHQYVWVEGSKYETASPEQSIAKLEKNFKDYAIAVFGDNHQGFLTKTKDGVSVFNCGSLMKRHSDQIDYKPQIGLLFDNGEIEPYYLDTSKDVYIKCITSAEEKDISESIKTFIKVLEALDSNDLNFSDAIDMYMKNNKVKSEVKNIIIGVMDKWTR
jgi:hypothetical protein